MECPLVRPTSVPRLPLLGLLVSLAVGCAAPQQSGEITILPGAAERLMLAMRMGYGGAGGAKPPARVARLTTLDERPAGAAARGKVGDWVLENATVTVVVSDVGGERGGQLVDFA